ncbi:MAG TPA: outer membrane beta-barrel protein, partial [Sphingobacteriaceae bacterium]|nr:outer membrane beta-barrel protein [Sphingobacteriaceae bacterium]
GGGGGGFGGGFGGGGRNGLTNVGSIGINYRKTSADEKLTTYGNYSYGRSDNNTLSNALSTYNYQDTVISDAEMSNQNTIGANHRFDWNLEYKPNDRDYLKLSPTFSINNNETSSLNNGSISTNGILDNIVSKQNSSNSKSPDVGISGLYNRRLNENGRNLFVDFSVSTSKSEQDRDEIVSSLSYVSSPEEADSLYQRQLIDLNNKRLNGGLSLSYTEPLSAKTGLEFNYSYNFANYDNSRIALDSDVDGITTPNLDNSNVYDYTFNTNLFSLTYRYRGEKMNYSLGASAQPSLLKGNVETGGNSTVIRRSAVNYAPVARFEYKFSRTQGININYSGRSSEPSFSQLQPIRDISNPQFPVTGNPNLDAEFIHSVRVRYNNFNTETGTTFFAFLDGSKTDNKIVSNRVSLPSELYGRVQETTYLNTDGFYSARGFYNLSRAFNKRKYVISANGSANFNNNVSFVDSEENVAKNWVLSQGFNFQVNLGEWLELMPGISYTFNTTENTITTRPTQDVSTWAMNFNSKLYIVPTLLWGVELSKMSNNGYSSGIAANPLIINTYIEKEFFKGKQGAIRLHAFDLLDEQVSVSRTVTANSILDNRSNRLSRYFMLSLTYKFQKFAGQSAAPDRSQEWRGGGGRPGF